jgi:hypothetical protein
MKGQFKTFMTQSGEFASIIGGEIYTSAEPVIILSMTATMEAAEMFYPECVKHLNIVTVNYETADAPEPVFVKKEETIHNILKKISDWANTPIEIITMKTRERDIVELRQLAMYFSKKLTKMPDRIIGEQIGKKDRNTVVYSHDTVTNLIETNREYYEKYKDLFKIFGL